MNGGQDDHRPKIGKKDIFHAVQALYLEHMSPVRGLRVEELLCWLIQTGEALLQQLPSVDLALPSSGNVLDFHSANALTACLTLEPSILTHEDILPLFLASSKPLVTWRVVLPFEALRLLAAAAGSAAAAAVASSAAGRALRSAAAAGSCCWQCCNSCCCCRLLLLVELLEARLLISSVQSALEAELAARVLVVTGSSPRLRRSWRLECW